MPTDADRAKWRRQKAAQAAKKRAAGGQSWVKPKRGRPKKGAYPSAAEAVVTMKQLAPPPAGATNAPTARTANPSDAHSESEPLPAVDIPISSDSTEDAPTDTQETAAPAPDSAQDAGSDASKSSGEPSSKQGKEGASNNAADTIAGDKLATMAAAMATDALKWIDKICTTSFGAYPVPEFWYPIFYESVEYLAMDALKDANVDKKKYASGVVMVTVIGEGANGYYHYYMKREAEKKVAAEAKRNGKTVIDVPSLTVRSAPGTGPGPNANGTAKPEGTAPGATEGAGPPAKARDYV